jgi:ribosomal protein S11
MQKQVKKNNKVVSTTNKFEKTAKKRIKTAPSFILHHLKNKKNVRRLRLRKNFAFTSNPSNPIFVDLYTNQLKNFNKQIYIKIKPNNVFCTLSDASKTIYTTSSGKCNLNTSKKTLRYTTKIILQSFLNNIKKHLEQNFFILHLTSPKKLRIAILKQLQATFKRKELIINIKGKKYFNGCRPAKKKRKKQKGLRLFK